MAIMVGRDVYYRRDSTRASLFPQVKPTALRETYFIPDDIPDNILLNQHPSRRQHYSSFILLVEIGRMK